MNKKLIAVSAVVLVVASALGVYAYQRTAFYPTTGSTININIAYWRTIPASSDLEGPWLEEYEAYWHIYNVSSERPLDVPWAAQIREKLLRSFYVAWAPVEDRIGEDKYGALTFTIGPIGYYNWSVKVLINGTLTDTQLSSLTKDVEDAVTSDYPLF